MESENPADKVFTGPEVISRDHSHVSSAEIQSTKGRAFAQTRPPGPSGTPFLNRFCQLSLRGTALNCRTSLLATRGGQKQSSCRLQKQVEHPAPLLQVCADSWENTHDTHKFSWKVNMGKLWRVTRLFGAGIVFIGQTAAL